MATLSRNGPDGHPETLRLQDRQVVQVGTGLFAIQRAGRIDRILRPGQVFLVDPGRHDDVLVCLESGQVSLSKPGPSSPARALAMAAQVESQSLQRFDLQRGLLDMIGPKGDIPGGPYDSNDCHLVAMVVEDPGFRSRVPRTLHAQPLCMPRYLLVFADYEGFGGVRQDGSSTRRVDLSYRETTLLAPVVHAGAGPGLYIPEIYPDSMMAVVAGREVFGFPKRYAETWMHDGSAGTIVDGKLAAQLSYSRLHALESEDLALELAAMMFRGRQGQHLPSAVSALPLTEWALEAVDTLPIFVQRREADFRSGREWTTHEIMAVPFRIHNARQAWRLQIDEVHLVHHRWRGGTVLAAWEVKVGMELQTAYPVSDLRPNVRGRLRDLRRRPIAAAHRGAEVLTGLLTQAQPMTVTPPAPAAGVVSPGTHSLVQGSPQPVHVASGHELEVLNGVVALFEDHHFQAVLRPGQRLGRWTAHKSPASPAVLGSMKLFGLTDAQVEVRPVAPSPSVAQLQGELELAERLHDQLKDHIAWRFEGDLAASHERKPYVGRTTNQCWELDAPGYRPRLPAGLLRLPGVGPALVHQHHEHLGPKGSDARLDFEQVGIWLPVLRLGSRTAAQLGFLLVRIWQNKLTALQISRDLGDYNTRYGRVARYDDLSGKPRWALFGDGQPLFDAPHLDEPPHSSQMTSLPLASLWERALERITTTMHGYAWKKNPPGGIDSGADMLHRCSARVGRLRMLRGPSEPVQIGYRPLAGASVKRAWLIRSSVEMLPARRIGLKRFLGR